MRPLAGFTSTQGGLLRFIATKKSAPPVLLTQSHCSAYGGAPFKFIATDRGRRTPSTANAVPLPPRWRLGERETHHGPAAQSPCSACGRSTKDRTAKNSSVFLAPGIYFTASASSALAFEEQAQRAAAGVGTDDGADKVGAHVGDAEFLFEALHQLLHVLHTVGVANEHSLVFIKRGA